MNNSSGKFRDWVLLLLCNLFWGSQPAMLKLVQSEMGPVFATIFPIAIAAMILFVFVLFEQRKKPPEAKRRISREDLRDFLLLGIGGQIVAQFFITWGTAPGWAPAMNASLMFLALPVCTCVMAYFILGERMTKLRMFSFALALAGVVFCSGIDWSAVNLTSPTYFWGNVLIFLSINGSAFYNVYSKKVLERYSPLQVMLYSYYALMVFMLPVLFAVEPRGFLALPHFGLKVWFGLFILAVFVYALAMVLFLNVLTRLDATQAGLSNYLLPFFGLLIAYFVEGGEVLTLPMILGGLLVLGSTLLITVYEEYQKSRKAASESPSIQEDMP